MEHVTNNLNPKNIIYHRDVYVHSMVELDGSIKIELMKVSDVLIPLYSCL